MQYLWVYKKVEQLDGQTGFVEVEDDLAQQLIDDDCAQNPECGAHYLKEIESGEYQAKEYKSDEYDTKVMTPAKKRINTKARAKESDE